MMESPLNKAHQQERRAEALLRSGKFKEAIECHQKAADYLMEAQSLTKAKKALESLELQHDHHIKQQAVIRAKQKQAQLQKQHQINSDDTLMGNIAPLSENPSQISGQSDMTLDNPDGELEDDTYRTMEETDSLLLFLQNRAVLMDSTRPYRNRQFIQSATKVPKDEKMIIEELKTHNLALRSHIEQLLEENAKLREELDQCKNQDNLYNNKPVSREDDEEEERFYSIPPNMNLSSLELPPLEMPQFDFDLMKAKMMGNPDT